MHPSDTLLITILLTLLVMCQCVTNAKLDGIEKQLEIANKGLVTP